LSAPLCGAPGSEIEAKAISLLVAGIGHAGEELVNIFGLAMKHGITATQIRDFVFAYPTFSADIKPML